ncbi:MAG: choice-of-anchor D domain-containing protein, partial [Acidobacteriota bacterium]|nr:choice-of-anchor D domain-containing protein [Acidobacteriota bacterium]
GATDAFVLKLNPAGSQALYSTFLGGTANDQGNGIAVDGSGNAYVAGSTSSADFPLQSPIQTSIDQGACAPPAACSSNAFVSMLNPQGSGLVYSTYLGGSGPDYGQAIATGASGNAYVAGATTSSNFPATGGTLQPGYGGQGTSGNGFVAAIAQANAPALSLNPQRIDFDSTALGFSSTAQAVTLTNMGSQQLSISGVTVSSNFAIKANTCGSTLAPGGAQCTVSVRFTPSSSASTTTPTTGTLTVSDDAPGSPQSVALSGTGATPAPAITYSPASLTFGNQLVGASSSPQTLTLTNSGTAPLTITAATVSGAFSQTNNCVTTLAPSASCTFNVTFSPTETVSSSSTDTASNSGSVSVTSNVSGTAPAANVTGTAVADFSLALTGPSSPPIAGATSTTITAAASSLLPSFTGNITFACSTEVTCAFNPTQITPGQSTTVTVTNLAGNNGIPNPNPVAFTVTGTSGKQNFAATASIATENFYVAATPPLNNIAAGETATYTISVSSVNGFNQAVALSCASGLPSGSKCSFSPATVTPGPGSPQTSALTITTTAHKAGLIGFPGPGGPGGFRDGALRDLLLLSLLAALALVLAFRKRRFVWVGFALVAAMAILLASCNMGYYGFIGSNPAPTGSPSGVYTVTIAGTFTPAAGSTGQAATTQITSVNLAVQ